MRTLRRQRQSPDHSTRKCIIGALVCLLIAAGVAIGIQLKKANETPEQIVRGLTEEILLRWKNGLVIHPSDKTNDKIFNVSSWAISLCAINENRTRARCNVAIESATDHGNPVRVNWTFVFLKTSAGWQARELFETDRAPRDVNDWDPR